MASNKLTPEQKMEMWHNGERKQNVAACSDTKLERYYRICVERHYVSEAAQLAREMQRRGIAVR